jgi:hypothetical protein
MSYIKAASIVTIAQVGGFTDRTPFKLRAMNYRGYNIQPCEYGGFLFNREDDERQHWTGMKGTVRDAKQEIDDMIFEATQYTVVIGETVVKFDWLTDALTLMYSTPNAILQFDFDAV